MINNMITHLIFFSLTYWFLIYGVLQLLLLYRIKEKQLVFDTIPDPNKIKRKIKEHVDKLGYKLVLLQNPFGMGYALPFSQNVFITHKLLNALTYEELLYVVHHEIGHIKNGHPNKQALWFMLFLFVYLMIFNAFGLNHIVFSLIFAVIFSDLGRYIARIHEDEADEYAVKHAGFDRAKEGILKLQQLYKTEYDHPLVYGYFSVHRTHLARIDRLKALTYIEDSK